MTLNLPKTWTIDEVLEAINADRPVCSERTIREIVRDLGYTKGRGRVQLFTVDQVQMMGLS